MNNLLSESPVNWQLGFQIPASPAMEGIINFHHDLFSFLVFILFFVIYALVTCIITFNAKTNKTPIVVTHAATLEIIWTIIPASILVLIAMPSFSLLYSIDEIVQSALSIKVVGHQWYWSYEFINPNFILNSMVDLMNTESADNNIESKEIINSLIENGKDPIISFDSYMIPDENIEFKNKRLLDVDNKVYVPVETNIRFLITSADVLHSWAVPALGIKLDACPGRLNQTSTYIYRPGNFYGQCSEICGVNHGFMPITITALNMYGSFDISPDDDSKETFALLLNFLNAKKLN